jgi:arsenite-transporting ATPase
MEIDPDASTREYIDRAMAPVRAAFPPQMVQIMEEQMSGPCTAEVAAFDRFTDFLEKPAQNVNLYDTVIFDTAPTGHTLRLLELPAEWSRTIEASSAGNGQTCIGPAAAIQDARHKYERAVSTLRDPAQTTFIFVLHPEAISIKETQRATAELGKLDIHTHQLIVNGIIPLEEHANPLFAARIEMQARYLKQIEKELNLPTQRMFLLPGEIKGLARLREVGKMFFDGAHSSLDYESELSQNKFPGSPLKDIQACISPNGHRRTIFFAGKGGVGKTAASCMTAVWLARQGYKTLLLTTDPAAHLGDVLGVPVGDTASPVSGQPNLWAAKIDPKTAAEAYKKRILDDARQRGRPAEAIAVMAEELDSPCTEEMAAFDRFIDFASQTDWQVVVFDTAPTGHTLRLIELPMDWSQQLDVKIFASVDTTAADDVAKQRFGQVIEMMRDPDQSTFAFVMYPESTPILEAYRAVQELRTVGIQPGLVVANQVIPLEQATTPYVRARRAMQEKYLGEIAERFPVPLVQIPLMPNEIKGIDLLAELSNEVYSENILVQPRK